MITTVSTVWPTREALLPQNLVEKIIRMKVYNTTYWKESCFGLTGTRCPACVPTHRTVVRAHHRRPRARAAAETLVDRAVELDHVGGTYGGADKPCAFLCLVLKMLQIQPAKDIVLEFVKNEDYKYEGGHVLVWPPPSRAATRARCAAVTADT